jgi:hypothetical protein
MGGDNGSTPSNASASDSSSLAARPYHSMQRSVGLGA